MMVWLSYEDVNNLAKTYYHTKDYHVGDYHVVDHYWEVDYLCLPYYEVRSDYY